MIHISRVFVHLWTDGEICPKTFESRIHPLIDIMVSQLIIQTLLNIAIILPMLLLFMKERTRANYICILAIVFCYFVSVIALILPNFPNFNFINGIWNWDGKIYSIVCGIAMYFIFRKQFSENNFFTLKQNKEGLKAAIWTAIAIISLQTPGGALRSKDFNIETLLFQLSMPGIDEEIMFRGILLGLMCSSLRGGRSTAWNPSIMINTILFGLVHTWNYQDGTLDINVVSFIGTGLVCYCLTYITLKTRSILLAILTHNLCNFLPNLVSML